MDPSVSASKQPVCGRCGTNLGSTLAEEVGGRPIIITDATFDRDVLSAGLLPVLLDCWAPWCGPCRVIAPILDQLAAESQGRYIIAKLNVDENPKVAAQFGIQSIPTMLIFKQGKAVDRLIGAQPKPAIAPRLAAIVNRSGRFLFMKRSPLLVIFITVLIDLIGFGIVIPVLLSMSKARSLTRRRWSLALLLASYSVMQLIFTPILGRLSDKYGRRPGAAAELDRDGHRLSPDGVSEYALAALRRAHSRWHHGRQHLHSSGIRGGRDDA
ncbi:MAG: thioredoxin [Pyrinomonadaceae bacterium]